VSEVFKSFTEKSHRTHHPVIRHIIIFTLIEAVNTLTFRTKKRTATLRSSFNIKINLNGSYKTSREISILSLTSRNIPRINLYDPRPAKTSLNPRLGRIEIIKSGSARRAGVIPTNWPTVIPGYSLRNSIKIPAYSANNRETIIERIIIEATARLPLYII